MRPRLPEPLRPLADLAFNLRWTWNGAAADLFRRLDPELWETTNRSPVRLLRLADGARLADAAADERYLAALREALHELHEHLESPGWFAAFHPEARDLRIAYFAAEFGLAECVPLYSGGLGILSGDHLKSASDLGLPLTGVGLLYRHGYFTQRLTTEGVQQELYPVTVAEDLPLVRELLPDGRVLRVGLSFPGREVFAEVWRAQVGRVRLLLLDTRIDANRPEDQVVTGALYGGDRENRLQQEIVLGMGGIRALAELGLRPDVCHLNEGHAAFLVLERIRQLVREEGLAFPQARDAAREGNVFTTHTPVPAGFDAFAPDLLHAYFAGYAEELGLGWREFLALGGSDGTSPFSMAALALGNSSRCNAVSRLHAEVSRSLFRSFHPPQELAAEELIPLSNGIHTASWAAREMKELLTRHLGPRWTEEPHEPDAWHGVDAIPDGELWAAHSALRAGLVEWVRGRLPQQLERRGSDPSDHAWARWVLDREALTIGWARRFATYKRATLLFHDRERLRRLLGDAARPVQVVLAGKAHPHDDEGKRMIRELASLAADPGLRLKVVFLANYDIGLARRLVRGVDLWLNTPRRPLEASGTSGMKVVVNGGLNLSVLDGWWAEAYDPEVGWAIDAADAHADHAAQDHAEADRLFSILENEIVPLFYDRGEDGVPVGWVRRMKASLRRLAPYYNTHRMVREYTERLYLPAAIAHDALAGGAAAREPAAG
jgi:starch phosphorylase